MSAVSTFPTRGRVEGEQLTRALITAAAQGQRPHCSDPGSSDLWLSDRKAERAQAARMCARLSRAKPQRRDRNGSESGQDVTRPARPNINHGHG